MTGEEPLRQAGYSASSRRPLLAVLDDEPGEVVASPIGGFPRPAAFDEAKRRRLATSREQWRRSADHG